MSLMKNSIWYKGRRNDIKIPEITVPNVSPSILDLLISIHICK